MLVDRAAESDENLLQMQQCLILGVNFYCKHCSLGVDKELMTLQERKLLQRNLNEQSFCRHKRTMPAGGD